MLSTLVWRVPAQARPLLLRRVEQLLQPCVACTFYAAAPAAAAKHQASSQFKPFDSSSAEAEDGDSGSRAKSTGQGTEAPQGDSGGAGGEAGGGANEGTKAGAGWASWAEKAKESAQKMRARFTGSGSGAGSGAESADDSAQAGKGRSTQSIVDKLRSEVAQAVLPEWETPSVMKRRTDVVAREIKVGEGPTDLVVQEVPQSWYEKLQERLGNTALAKRLAALRETEAMRSVADGYASVKERLEAGDSEVVNRVSEMGERLMAETETARALREIRMRHPAFDMPSFLRAIKKEVPIVIKAYLEGSSDVLKEYCSDAMLERFEGIYKATVAQGQVTDSTILEFSDVDMIDMKMLDDHPVVILHFSVQQINCVRDTYGNVVSGSPDEVNRVYYYWAVQMDGHGMVTEDGQYIPPRWKLIEMLLRGMHQLL